MNKFYIICFLSLTCAASKMHIQDNEFKTKLCIKNGIEKYFGKNANLLLITNMVSVNFPAIENPHDFLETKRNIGNNSFKFKNYVLFGKTLLTLRTVTQKLINSKYWGVKECMTKRVLVFIFSEINSEEIFNLFWKNNLYNVILIKFTNNFTEVFTANPFTNSSRCGLIVNLEYKGTCEKMENIFFSKYPRTLKGCHVNLNLLNIVYPADLISENFTSKKPGIFVKPMKIISEIYQLNVTTTKLDQKDVKQYQKMFILDYSKTNSNEVLFGIVDNLYIYTQLESTKSCFDDTYCWILSKPDKLSNVKIMASIFNKAIWTYIIIIFVTSYIVMSISIKYKNDRFATSSLLLDLYRVTVASALNKLPQTRVLKCLLMFYVFFTYHVNTYFQAKLGSILTAPLYEKEITTFEELADSTVIPVEFYKINSQLLNNSYSYASMKLFNRLVFYKEIENNRINCAMEHKNTALPINCKIMRNLTEAHKEFLSIIPDKALGTTKLFYSMINGSPYIFSFDAVIRGIIEGGLFLKWLSDNKKITFLPTEDNKVVLTIDHVETAFVIIFAGCILAFIIFLFEILVYSYQDKLIITKFILQHNFLKT